MKEGRCKSNSPVVELRSTLKQKYVPQKTISYGSVRHK